MASVFAPLVTSRVSGYDFGDPMPAGGWIGTGQSFGWTKHLGSDIGTPAGSPIVAAADSTLAFQTGLTGYGNLLTEKFANGWEFLFGHVAGGASGPVKAGQKIGVTGANVGSARGAVTLFQVKNPQGVSVNPDPILQALVSGKAQASQYFGMASGQAGPTVPQQLAAGLPPLPVTQSAGAPLSNLLGLNPSNPLGLNVNFLGFNPSNPLGLNIADPLGLGAAVTGVGHGLADFFVVAEQDVADWLKRQAVAFFVAAVVLLVLFA